MRLCSLRFENLNSLRGPVSLDFDRGQLAIAGLFAITGPTGAGKSTLLDAISLALYGATPRGQGEQIISHGKRDAAAEVEFETHGKRYRSSWSIHVSKPRKASSTPRARITMELAELAAAEEGTDSDAGATIIADKVRGERSVPAHVERVTGLDFQRFRQAVVLAQGQFDAFLLAPAKDRSELLEQITGTAIYSEVSKRVYAEHSRRKDEVQQRRTLLEQRGVPDPAEEEGWRQRTAAIEAERPALESTLARLRTQLASHEQRVELVAERERIAAAIITYERDAEDRARDRRRLSAHAQALPLQADASRLSGLRREGHDLATHSESLSGRLAALTAQLPERRGAATSALEAYEAAQRASAKTDADVERLGAIAQASAAIAERIAQLQSEQTAVTAALAESEQRVTSLTETGRQAALDRQAAEARLVELAAFEKAETRLPDLAAAYQADGEARKSLRDTTQQIENERAALGANAAALARLRAGAPPEPPCSLLGGSGAGDPDAALRGYEALADTLRGEKGFLERFGGSLRPYTQQLDEARQQLEQRAAAEAELISDEKALEKLADSLTAASDRSTRLQRATREALQAYEAIKLAAGLRAQHAHLLADGEPCPLCGALEHPAAAEALDDAEPESFRRKWEAAVAEEAAAQTEVETLTKQRDALAARIDKTRDRRDLYDADAIRQRLDAERDRVLVLAAERPASLRGDLPGDIPLDGATLNRLLVLHRDRAQRLAAVDEERVRYVEYVRIRRAHEAEEASAKTVAATIENRIASLRTLAARQTDRAAAAARTLTALVAELGLGGVVPGAAGLLESVRTGVSALRDTRARLRVADEKLAGNVELVAAAEAATARQRERLARLADALEARSGEHDRLRAERAALLGDAPGAAALSNAAGERLAAARAAHATAAERLAQHEREATAARTTLAGNAKRAKALEASAQALAGELASRAAERGFADLEDARGALLDEAAASSLAERLARADEEEVRLGQRRQSNADALARLEEALREAPPATAVAAELRERERAHAALLSEFGGLSAQLRRAAADRAAAAAAAEHIAALEAELADWTTLNALVGSADGAKFRKFAQRITLRQLLGFANEYLRDFYPRFSVSADPDPESESLEVLICDHYEGEQIRSANTISGGERFLVSMALALGFSRMASKQMPIDTLFIDEGFGTLDAQVLDRAIDALEHIRHTGKTIGIISHVAALQERIGTQIRLTRQGEGRSTLSVVA